MTATTLTPNAPSGSSVPPATPPPFAAAKVEEYNRLNLNFAAPLPRPKVRGKVIDIHTHLLATRHAPVWFQTAKHFGIDTFFTMSPLEECMGLQRDWQGRIHFIAVPKWGDASYDDWMRRLECFYNMGSRIIKFHMAPQTMQSRQYRLDSPEILKIIREAVARNMIIMTHMGDPDTWYFKKYTDHAKFGTRDDHYRMWEQVMGSIIDRPWLGAHMGGNPEDLGRLQSLLDRFPNLYLDSSATRWMVREISARRDAAREFFIRNQDRICFGSDQVSYDDRGFDFLASRWWCHRKLWETAYIGPSPIIDPDVPDEQQPTLRGLALPDTVLQKLYHDNAITLLARVNVTLD